MASAAGAASEAAAPGRRPRPAGQNLAETGGSDTTAYVAVGGAVVLAAGAALVFGAARRRNSA